MATLECTLYSSTKIRRAIEAYGMDVEMDAQMGEVYTCPELWGGEINPI
jgi:hypothetical protein